MGHMDLDIDVRVMCAIGVRGQLGLNGQLPWEGDKRPPFLEDVARFFEMTRGHVLLAGPKTVASIPKFAFQDRTIVILRSWMSPKETLEQFRGRIVFIGGGPPVWFAYAPFVRHWDVTRLPYDGPADVWFDPSWLIQADSVTEGTHSSPDRESRSDATLRGASMAGGERPEYYFRQEAEKVALQQRKIQEAVNAEEESAGKSVVRPMQSGTREYPEEFPPQHLPKPGMEADLNPPPMFEAPGYRGSGKLTGFVSLITGGDSGIGRAVAVLFAREGADVAIAYLNEHEDAERTRRAVEDEGRRCIVISGNVANPEFCRAAVERTVQEFGRLDVLVNNAAFQEHTVDFVDLSDEHFDQTVKTNLYGYFYMARAAVPHIKPGGSIIMTGSVTGFFWKQAPARLRNDQGRHTCFHALASGASDAARHPRQRYRTWSCVDAA